MENRYLNVKEVAAELNISDTSVYRHLASGKLIGYKVGPRLWRIRMEDVHAFAEAVSMARGVELWEIRQQKVEETRKGEQKR